MVRRDFNKTLTNQLQGKGTITPELLQSTTAQSNPAVNYSTHTKNKALSRLRTRE